VRTGKPQGDDTFRRTIHALTHCHRSYRQPYRWNTAYAQYDRQPGSSPAAESAVPSAGAAKSATPDTGATLTETQAKTRIEGLGFTNVSELKKDSKGMWNARAMKDGKQVQLSMDTQGRITQLN